MTLQSRNRFWSRALALTGLALSAPLLNGCPAPGCDPTTVTDPLFNLQWHLLNTGALTNATAGEDAKVKAAWDTQCVTGNGVVVSVVDDGVDLPHEDLAANNNGSGHWNYHPMAPSTADPNHVGNNSTHGTAVAGVIAAAGNNLGGRGIAPNARIVGFNLIESGMASGADEGDAMLRARQTSAVSNNSWGAADGVGLLATPSVNWMNGVQDGVANGRGGRGTVYLWASGNGGLVQQPAGVPFDNSNYDGQANNPNVFAIGAVGANGQRAVYSERGANVLVVAPSWFDSAPHPAITTTDATGGRGDNPNRPQAGVTPLADQNYSNIFDGTSAATPMVAGVVALMLEANPNLGWRDVRNILARSARKVDPNNNEWATNNSGLNIHPGYGFGAVDANAAVAMARGTANLPALQTFVGPNRVGPVAIPDNGQFVDQVNIVGSPIGRIEYVQMRFSSNHTNSGELDIQLTSPQGVVSRMAETHLCNPVCSVYASWDFGSTKHLGDPSNGTWTLTVRDMQAGIVGQLQDWRLTFYGTP